MTASDQPDGSRDDGASSAREPRPTQGRSAQGRPTPARPMVRLGTRSSDLALWQAHHVADRLSVEADVDLVRITTRGDRIQDVPLTGVDGRAFFTAEIEQALLDRRVDLAVHSHKDLATENPPELTLAAVTTRHAPLELLLALPGGHDPAAAFLPLRHGARVGTDAPRRAGQLGALRPDIRVTSLRGNVPTRVQKLRDGGYEAIVLAAAGLERLGLDLSDLIVVRLPPALMVPAPAQGALAIQARGADDETCALLRRHLHDADSAAVIGAERSALALAGGGCQLPLGVNVAPSAGDAADGNGDYRALAFLGADHPHAGAPPRWAEGHGVTPAAAVDHAWERLAPGTATGCGPFGGEQVTLVGSSDGADSLLAQRLSILGAVVNVAQVLRFEPVAAPALGERLAQLVPGDVVAVTSRQAARPLLGLTLPPGVCVAAVGPSTAAALVEAGLRADHVGSGGARELAASIPLGPGARVLFPCAADARPELADGLAERGAALESVIVYRSVPVASPTQVHDVFGALGVGADSPATGASPEPAADRASVAAAHFVYMSPSAVEAAVRCGLDRAAERRVRLALGRSTAQALQAAGLEHESPDGSGVEALIACLARRHPLSEDLV